jgi:hypothetical protein
MSSSPRTPSAKAPTGVAKISMVYGPGGALGGQTRLKKFGTVTFSPAGIARLSK